MIALALDPQQVADLREVQNVGAGRAASALADLLGLRCRIDVPAVTLGRLGDLLGGAIAEGGVSVAIWMRVLGDVPLLVVIGMARPDAAALLAACGAEPDAPGGGLPLPTSVVLREVAAAVTHGYAEALCDLLALRARGARAEVAVDRWDVAVATVLRAHAGEECALVRSRFACPEGGFGGWMFLSLTADAARAVLARIEAL